VTPPGAHGFDICVGEGQAWESRRSSAGRMWDSWSSRCAKRHMPGRLVGETVDVDSKRAYVLRSPREQHPPRKGDVEHLHE
jgi:glycine dehydrogenase subunit 1